jgi:hypothetical protein
MLRQRDYPFVDLAGHHHLSRSKDDNLGASQLALVIDAHSKFHDRLTHVQEGW